MRPDRLEIHTAEGVTFALPLAGPFTRFMAWLIDALAVVAAGSLLSTAGLMVGVIDPDLAQALVVAAYFVLSIGYGVVLEWRWRGQTLGKRLFGLRVVDASGLDLTLAQVLIRNLLRAVDALPAGYLVGGAALLISHQRQRLGDLAAGTVVVRPHRRSLELPARSLAPRFNSLAAHPHLVARLAQRISPQALELGVGALLRRDQLEPGARLDVFAALAEHYRAAVPFPATATDTLTDEAYVRNVVAAIQRPTTPRRRSQESSVPD